MSCRSTYHNDDEWDHGFGVPTVHVPVYVQRLQARNFKLRSTAVVPLVPAVERSSPKGLSSDLQITAPTARC